MTDRSRVAHVAELTIIFVLGLIPSVTVVSTSGYQIDGFLPDLCVPSSRDVLFYSILLPIQIGATVGLTMLFTAFRILRRVSILYSTYTHQLHMHIHTHMGYII